MNGTLTPMQLAQIVAELQRQGLLVRQSSGAGYFTGVRAGTYPVPRNLIVDGKGRVVSVQAGVDASSLEVQDEGILVGTRPAMNFTGAGVVATDDPANDRVVVTVANGTSGVVAFGDNSVAATTTTRYLHPWYEESTAETAGGTNARIVLPRAGVIRNMRVRHGNPAGNGNAIVYTLRVNAAAQALTVSLASTATNGSDLVNSVVVAAGDQIDVEVTKAATIGASPNNITVTMEYA